MKKYLIDAGFKYKPDYNDMLHKQFYLEGVEYANSDQSILGKMILDREETYVLFLKDIDAKAFKSTIEGIINAASYDKVPLTLGNSISVERQENGYLVTMSFIIEG